MTFFTPSLTSFHEKTLSNICSYAAVGALILLLIIILPCIVDSSAEHLEARA